jgi:guanylate kinase
MAEQHVNVGGRAHSARQGPLIIVSGASGSGKSTLIARLLIAMGDRVHLSISATTRAPRPGEKDGKDYYFWSPERFNQELGAGEFLEWAEVHGQRYGTLKSEVLPYRERGIGVILEIDVQGAKAIRRMCPDNFSVFLRTESLDTYERRLRRRGTENEASLSRRLAAVQGELEHVREYDKEIINEDLDAAVGELRSLVEAQFEGGPNVG